jgi:2-polyprenyl-3-methyl-5-hydroxy-6-metoxy-1,4-benzoquinol methylase
MDKIKNYLHHKLFFLYSFRNFISDNPVWLSYTNNDLIIKSENYIKFIKPKNNCKVIDLGCGNGIMLKPYLTITKPENIYGSDIIYTNISQTRTNLPSVPTSNFSVSDMTKIEGKYDVILIHGVIGTIDYNEQNAFLENLISSSLKNNGHLILGAINFVTDKYIFQTYPLKDLSFIKKICKKYNLKYDLRHDIEFDKTGKYNAHTLFIQKQ